MLEVEWDEIAEYVGAGNVDRLTLSEDLDAVLIDIVYLGSSHGTLTQVNISLECSNCCYLDVKRRDDHEPGTGIILDAYLHKESGLISALHAHRLDAKAGCPVLEAAAKPVYHLELVGEVSVNVLCERLIARRGPFQTTKEPV